mmetsp:Transcript_15481/g.17184  ORF Transcript_15481/g.17184 Transcript_15481/m.17184 type:complete len:91 (+) Transcript_15481:233-505(+)
MFHLNSFSLCTISGYCENPIVTKISQEVFVCSFRSRDDDEDTFERMKRQKVYIILMANASIPSLRTFCCKKTFMFKNNNFTNVLSNFFKL